MLSVNRTRLISELRTHFFRKEKRTNVRRSAEQMGAPRGNGASVVERFKHAAHGRVRHSVRWHTARDISKRRKHLALDGLIQHDLTDGSRVVTLRSQDSFLSDCLQGTEQHGKLLRKRIYKLLGSIEKNGVLPDSARHVLTGVNSNAPIALALFEGVVNAYADLSARYLHIVFKLLAVLAPALVRRRELKHCYRTFLTRYFRTRQTVTRSARPIYARTIPPTAPLAPPAL